MIDIQLNVWDVLEGQPPTFADPAASHKGSLGELLALENLL